MRGNLNMYSRLVLIALITLSFSLTTMARAQSNAPPVARRTTKPASGSKSASTEDLQLYRNSTFAFRFQIPYGWVDRSAEMQKGKGNDAGKSEVMLAVFERPPDATGDTINSAVVIASESVASYPGLKKAEDYLGPLTELATAKGFKADGDPYLLEVEGRQLWRADFLKPLSGTVTMKQCTLVLLAKGHIVSFTFISGSDDALDDLMDGLHFGVVPAGARK
jgi:hypothetical protein